MGSRHAQAGADRRQKLRPDRTRRSVASGAQVLFNQRKNISICQRCLFFGDSGGSPNPFGGLEGQSPAMCGVEDTDPPHRPRPMQAGIVAVKADGVVGAQPSRPVHHTRLPHIVCGLRHAPGPRRRRLRQPIVKDGANRCIRDPSHRSYLIGFEGKQPIRYPACLQLSPNYCFNSPIAIDLLELPPDRLGLRCAFVGHLLPLLVKRRARYQLLRFSPRPADLSCGAPLAGC